MVELRTDDADDRDSDGIEPLTERQYVLGEIRWLYEGGCSVWNIADRLGRKPQSIIRAVQRAGDKELARRLDAQWWRVHAIRHGGNGLADRAESR